MTGQLLHEVDVCNERDNFPQDFCYNRSQDPPLLKAHPTIIGALPINWNTKKLLGNEKNYPFDFCALQQLSALFLSAAGSGPGALQSAVSLLFVLLDEPGGTGCHNSGRDFIGIPSTHAGVSKCVGDEPVFRDDKLGGVSLSFIICV